MPNLKMAFSVMPRRAVTAARMNTARPVKMWTGRRAFRRWDARPGKFHKIRKLVIIGTNRQIWN